MGYTGIEKKVCVTDRGRENYVFIALCSAKKEGMKQVEQQ